MTLRAVVGWLIFAGAIVVAGLAIAGLAGSCERDRDVPGQRADSVLATDTTYRQHIADQDVVIARLEDSIRASDRTSRRWRDSARVLTRRVDASQAAINSTVAAGVPPGVEPAVFWRDQFQAQARVAASLRLQVIPALEATIAADSIAIVLRDTEKLELESQRDFARERARQVTAEFARYRQDSKPGIDLGLFRVPEWVGYAVVGVGAATLTYVAVK